jgi:hypothetical protein
VWKGDGVQCKSGFKVCEFVVLHRVGLKVVFGDTVVARGWWIVWPSPIGGVRGNDNVVDSLAISRQCSVTTWWIV